VCTKLTSYATAAPTPSPTASPTPSPTPAPTPVPVSALVPSWHATGCTTAALPGGNVVAYESWAQQRVLDDMYAWCTDAMQASNSHETGCCGGEGCGARVTCS
jgi:hypothetical protein